MLTNVELLNFKSFLKEDLKLSNLNLLTGINGLGKSTVIQALLLLRQSYIKGLVPQKGILLNGELIKLGRGSDVLNIHSESQEINFILRNHSGKFLDLNVNYAQDDDFLPINYKHKNVFDVNGETNVFNDKFKYLSAERISPKSSYSVSLFEVDKNRSIGIHGEYTSLFISRYQRDTVKLKHACNQTSESDRLIDQISAWLKEISPGINIKSTYFPEIESSKLSYQYNYDNILTPEFSPNNVGFGLTYVLPVVTCILASNPGDLIIIENPESHLHPSGQSKLGELIFRAALDGVQIITETHSDHILNGVRIGVKKQGQHADIVKILYFQRDQNPKVHLAKVQYPKLDNNGQIDSWPDGFFDQSVNDLNFLFGL